MVKQVHDPTDTNRVQRADDDTPEFDPSTGYICMDCGVDTFDIGEYHMLEDEVWAKVHDSYEGMLCVGCVEMRLGRRLTPIDFADVPVNKPHEHQSERLRSRVIDSGVFGQRSA